MAESEFLVARSADLLDGSVIIVSTPKNEIGVFRSAKGLFAYANVCVHQGGPVCEGIRVPKVEDVVGEDKSFIGQKFDDDELHIVCPWHGYEFKLDTGECVGDPKLSLTKYEVIERDGYIYVLL